ncbi:MAG TPA: right-handed parallel beta-helix repeat-containing protein [Allosphingosinicella sp.]|jgi:hypothetical protein
MQIDRRTALAYGFTLIGAGLVPQARLFAQTGTVLTPEQFGAKGDGRTNDSAAFWALSQRVNELGGATIALRDTVYIVAEQHLGREGEAYAYMPRPILYLRGCPRGVAIRGNGAVLRCPPGLRFGTFDRATGRPTRHQLPFYDASELAIPYEAMIFVGDCSGPVRIEDIELDGNIQSMDKGGPFGDTGLQTPGSGIFLHKNRGDEIVRNVFSHHHPQDGLMIDGLWDPGLAGRTRRIENFKAEHNARQGCSIVAGRGYAFSNCRFAHTGKAGTNSPPAAGVDIEAEDGRQIRDLKFDNCQFVDNSGCGLLADSGDTDGAQFTRCTFVGTTSWSCWPAKPNFHFRNCTFVGAVVRNYGHEERDPTKATQYFDCTFTDDPALSETGEVYLPEGRVGTICDVSVGDNTTFQRCNFRLVAGGLLPWSWRAIYVDCNMVQAARTVSYPKGRYLGSSTIRGEVDLYGTIVDGRLDANGTVYTAGTRFGGAPSDAEWPRPRLQR